MMESPIKVGLVYGSTRPGRFCDTIARWATGQIAARDGFGLETIDPRRPSEISQLARAQEATHRPRAMHLSSSHPNTITATRRRSKPLHRLLQARNGMPKPVAFVSYGGVSGGLRAVEQLRLVFAELHAVTIRDSVSFAGAWEQFDANGALRSPERAERSMDAMLRRLHWWAVSLAHARSIWPYAKTV